LTELVGNRNDVHNWRFVHTVDFFGKLVSAETEPRRRSWTKLAKLAFRFAVLALVCIGIANTVTKAWDEFQQQQWTLRIELRQTRTRIEQLQQTQNPDQQQINELCQQEADLVSQQFSLRQISVTWLVVAAAFYMVGLLPCWLYWHQTLEAMGQRPRLLETLRAYFLGHLGKYVPGKAMVVVLRTDGVRSERVDTTVAAASVFVETLTMMAVGAFVAAAILLATTDQSQLGLLAVVLMLCSGIPTLPPIFRRIVRTIQLRKISENIDDAIRGLNFRLALVGWLTISVGWYLLGLSLWATLQAIPGTEQTLAATFDIMLLSTASVALAMVAGFLSLLPGGVGVRDYLVMALVAPVFGSNVIAVCSAVLLRLVWLLAELMSCAILWLLIRRPHME
jgi:uncharacterized membrane protein YbhN (UPF0104 family)